MRLESSPFPAGHNRPRRRTGAGQEVREEDGGPLPPVLYLGGVRSLAHPLICTVDCFDGVCCGAANPVFVRSLHALMQLSNFISQFGAIEESGKPTE